MWAPILATSASPTGQIQQRDIPERATRTPWRSSTSSEAIMASAFTKDEHRRGRSRVRRRLRLRDNDLPKQDLRHRSRVGDNGAVSVPGMTPGGPQARASTASFATELCELVDNADERLCGVDLNGAGSTQQWLDLGQVPQNQLPLLRGLAIAICSCELRCA